MISELLYTSAARGLFPGSSGFCTVACTKSMSKSLLEALEALSGYRQVFPPTHARAKDNPTAYSHLTLMHHGKRLSVLSRVGFAGLDYSNRSNKLAHHIVLEPLDRPSEGPGALLTCEKIFSETWNGKVGFLPSRQLPRNNAANGKLCLTWEKVTGDQRWAHVVVNQFLNERKQLVYFVVEPGMPMLHLIEEALSLVPIERRWEVTFNTFFTGLSSDYSCLWRGVLKGSPEHIQAQTADALILDLTRRMGPAPRLTNAELYKSTPAQVDKSSLETNDLIVEPVNRELTVRENSPRLTQLPPPPPKKGGVESNADESHQGLMFGSGFATGSVASIVVCGLLWFFFFRSTPDDKKIIAMPVAPSHVERREVVTPSSPNDSTPKNTIVMSTSPQKSQERSGPLKDEEFSSKAYNSSDLKPTDSTLYHKPWMGQLLGDHGLRVLKTTIESSSEGMAKVWKMGLLARWIKKPYPDTSLEHIGGYVDTYIDLPKIDDRREFVYPLLYTPQHWIVPIKNIKMTQEWSSRYSIPPEPAMALIKYHPVKGPEGKAELRFRWEKDALPTALQDYHERIRDGIITFHDHQGMVHHIALRDPRKNDKPWELSSSTQELRLTGCNSVDHLKIADIRLEAISQSGVEFFWKKSQSHHWEFIGVNTQKKNEECCEISVKLEKGEDGWALRGEVRATDRKLKIRFLTLRIVGIQRGIQKEVYLLNTKGK